MGCPGRKRPPSAKTQEGCCEGRSTKARFLRSLCPAEPLSPFLCISVSLLTPSPHYTPCVSLSPTLFLCLSVCLSLCPISSHVDTNTSEKNRRLGGRDLHHSLARQEQGDSVRIKSADTQSATETPAITCIWTSCKPPAGATPAANDAAGPSIRHHQVREAKEQGSLRRDQSAHGHGGTEGLTGCLPCSRARPSPTRSPSAGTATLWLDSDQEMLKKELDSATVSFARAGVWAVPHNGGPW